MEKEIVVPSSQSTQTIILNIEGILENLRTIISDDIYEGLVETFNNIKEEKDTFDESSAKMLREQFPSMWETLTNQAGSSTRNKLKAFESNTLKSYEKYNSFRIKIEEVQNNIHRLNIYNENEKSKLIYNALELIDIIKTLSYAVSPMIINNGIDAIYDILVLTNNNMIIDAVNSDEFLKEKIGRKIQKYNSIPSRSIDYDFIDQQSIEQAQKNDSHISDLIQVNMTHNNERIEKNNQVNEKINEYDAKINENIQKAKKLKTKKRLISLRNGFIAALFPFGVGYGYYQGKLVSDANPLYSTQTQITDLSGDTPVIIEQYEEDDQTLTQYVSTISIASPWRQTITGGNTYTRDVKVYSFTKPEDAPENYTLKKEDLNENNLTLLYSYPQTTTSKPEKLDEEILVTETFQSKENPKENESPIQTGVAAGFFGGAVLAAGAYFLKERLIYKGVLSDATAEELNGEIDEILKKNINIQKSKEQYLEENKINVTDDIDYAELLKEKNQEGQKLTLK